MHNSRFSRRDALKLLGVSAALGLVDRSTLARILADPKRLSWRVNRTAERQGAWRIDDIEGRLPVDLNGTLYRVAPGQSENHGVVLRHLFDGDAFASGFSIRDGQVTLCARFVQTPARMEEQDADRMIYSEYGTAAPHLPGQRPGPPKNQPSVNVIAWDGRLLALSESGHPSALDPADLSFQGFWDFHGTLPDDVSFTAHPRFDPETGEGFGWGLRRGRTRELVVYRMQLDGRLSELASLPQSNASMVHDAILTDEHVVFAIPPMVFDFAGRRSGGGTPGDVLTHLEEQPIQIHLIRKDGTDEPISIEGPTGVLYHHGNAFAAEDSVVFDSLIYPHDGVNRLLHSVSEQRLPELPLGVVTRVLVDPVEQLLLGAKPLDENHELPRFDARQTGRDLRTLYTLQTDPMTDPLAFTRVARHDLHRNRTTSVAADPGRAFGEAVFVPHPTSSDEELGWLLHFGYEGSRDETFLDIRDAATLEREARVWSGTRFPLGFHGNFTQDHFVEIS